MGLTSKDLAYKQAFETTLYTLHFLKRIYFKTFRSQSVAYFLWSKVEINILLQPFVRYIHYDVFLQFRLSRDKSTKK